MQPKKLGAGRPVRKLLLLTVQARDKEDPSYGSGDGAIEG